MSDVAGWPNLGALPLQDHRPTDPQGNPLEIHRRMVPMAGRVVARDAQGRTGLEGHEGGKAGGGEKSLGDLGLGSTLWRAIQGQRPIPAWFLTAPAATRVPAIGGPAVPPVPPGVIAFPPPFAQASQVAPAGTGRFDHDPRFQQLAAGLPAATRLPTGWPVVVVSATDETQQLPLAFPASGPIVAVHHAGDPRAARTVVDLDPQDRADPSRAAEFHRLARVAMLDGGKFLSSGPTLVVRHGYAVDGHAGLGLVDGGAGGGAPPLSPGTAETVEAGAAKPTDDLVTRTRDTGGTIARDPSLPGPGPGGTIGRELRTPGSQLGPRNVLAALSQAAGGPIDLGGASDVHRLGTTLDGEPVNAAHLSTMALFRDPSGARDCPLDFESAVYVEPPPFPFTSRVHLRTDPKAAHGGKVPGPGLHRFLAEIPLYPEENPPRERWDPPPGGPRTDPRRGGGDGGPPGGGGGGGNDEWHPPPPDTYEPVPPGGGGGRGGRRGPRQDPGGTSGGLTGSITGSNEPKPITNPEPGPPPGPPPKPTSPSGFGFGYPPIYGFPTPGGESTGGVIGGPGTGAPTAPTGSLTPAPPVGGSTHPATTLCMIFGGNIWIRPLDHRIGAPNLTTVEGVEAAGGGYKAQQLATLMGVGTQLVGMAPTPTAALPPRTDGTAGPPAVDGQIAVLPGDVDPAAAIRGDVTASPTGKTGGIALLDGLSAVKTGQAQDGQLAGGTTWTADGKVITFESDTHTFEVDLASGEARMDGVPLGTGGGGSAGALPGGTGADGDYDPADGASLAAGLPNYDDYTLQAGRTIKGNAGQFHYVQVAGDATLNGTINLDGRGNDGGNGGAGGASSAAGNGTNGTAGSAGTGTKAATAGGGARGGGSGSGDGATRSGGNGGTGGTGGNRGAPWSADGQGTGGAGTAGGTGAGSAGTLGGNATAVNPTLLARRVSHDFLVALLGGAGGGGGGGGGGYAAGTVVAAGGAGASTYADADGTGEDGADGTFSVDSSGGGGGGKGGRGGGVYVMVVRGNVSGTFTINARGAQGGNGGVGNATGGDGGAGGGGGGGFCLVVFYGTWSATLTCNVGGGDSPAGQGAGEDGFYAVVNGSTGEVVQWGGSLASIAERTSALVAVQPTVSAAPADPLVATAPTTLVPVDTSGGAFAVELPPADSVEVGDSLILKDTGGAATANPLTVDANAADTIDGGASTSLGVDSGAITIQKITANTWMIV